MSFLTSFFDAAWKRYRHKPILPDCPNGFHFQLKKQLNCACPTGYDIERSTASLLPTYPCKMAELLKLGSVSTKLLRSIPTHALCCSVGIGFCDEFQVTTCCVLSDVM